MSKNPPEHVKLELLGTLPLFVAVTPHGSNSVVPLVCDSQLPPFGDWNGPTPATAAGSACASAPDAHEITAELPGVLSETTMYPSEQITVPAEATGPHGTPFSVNCT